MSTTDNTRSVKLETVQQIVQSLMDKDCPYLGHFKLGYESALDDLRRELDRLEWMEKVS